MKKTIKITTKVIHVKLTILAFILLPLAVFTLITAKTDKIGGIQSFVVLTGSMSPTIPQGSVIFTKKAHAYGEGDVIAFDKGGRNITHRITGVETVNGDTYFQTQGDANDVADRDLVPSQDVVGRTVFHMPYVGNAILNLRTPLGFGIFIILPGIVFIGFELWNIKKEIVRSTREKLMKEMSAA